MSNRTRYTTGMPHAFRTRDKGRRRAARAARELAHAHSCIPLPARRAVAAATLDRTAGHAFVAWVSGLAGKVAGWVVSHWRRLGRQ